MKTPIYPQTRVSVSKDQVSSHLEGEVVVLGLKKGIYYGLNPVAAFVWDLIQDRPRRFEELLDALNERYEVQPPRSSRDLERLIKDLHAQGLVEVRPSGSRF